MKDPEKNIKLLDVSKSAELLEAIINKARLHMKRMLGKALTDTTKRLGKA